ncbi:concanavalin A-like lectin/glucanase domain-containing protein [Talaromyces proteolyticus]|uniref:Concanavalin A-like lectin/glucanase domain-containing protein n=1 Tax=Talaromyces proteolyticus TaxID=1131652 RepID=A0AAD4PUA4_9EURO|nr:concanavalin A-like lectin/glucanase domain-containing protein [Talaromyces proteolyticus]KAH8692020.1 concanavalin A-like lectin/glucanase domain-containing protein [Talaromyces proteolyticus]
MALFFKLINHLNMLSLLLLPLVSKVAQAGNAHSAHHHKNTVGRSVPTIPDFLGHRGYELTWFDDFFWFPGTDGLPSSTNWIFDLGTSYPGGAEGWGNNEAELYTNSPNNVHITQSSTLAITPRLSSNGTWTSARIETARSDFAASAGGKLYIESRLRTGCAATQHQQGIWPAFWALGQEFRGNYTNWPAASEWDFLEVINGLPTMYSTLHCGTTPGGPCNENNGLGDGGVTWTGCEWHTVGFEVDRTATGGESDSKAWHEEMLTWYLDGEQIYRVQGSQIDDATVWEKIAHQGHFLLLNVAVGGNWPGQPNATTVDGVDVQMEVEYVAVWNSDSWFGQ